MSPAMEFITWWQKTRLKTEGGDKSGGRFTGWICLHQPTFRDLHTLSPKSTKEKAWLSWQENLQFWAIVASHLTFLCLLSADILNILFYLFGCAGSWVFPGSSEGKESACSVETWVHSLVGKIPWRRTWQPTPVLRTWQPTPVLRAWQPPPIFFPGESQGQRSLAGCGQRGRKKSDTTKSTEYAGP